MLRSTLFVMVMAYGLAACGGGPCDGGGGFFGSSERAAAAPSVPTISVGVIVDTGNIVLVEIVATTGGACSAGSTQTSRFVWDPARRTLTATMDLPSMAARRVSGASLGGGVITWENVVQGLTVRALTNPNGNQVLNFTYEGMTTTFTCAGSFSVTCS